MIKNKKNLGLTMIETLVTVTISLIVLTFIIQFVSKNIVESGANRDISNNISRTMKAIIERVDTDYSIAGIETGDYQTTDELNDFVESLNGINSNCGAWTPNSGDDRLNELMIAKTNLSCEYLSKSPLRSKVAVNVDDVKDKITVEYYYDNGKMKDNFENWVSISKSLIIDYDLVGYGAQTYNFIDKNSKETITNTDCINDYDNCSFAMSYKILNETDSKYLSTIGENNQVGKIKFTNGLLNPQVCQKWNISETGEVENKEDVFCGIENEEGKIKFLLNSASTESLTASSSCDMLEIDVNDNIVGKDLGEFPCGVIKIRRNTDANQQLLISSIADQELSDEAKTGRSTTVDNNANDSTHIMQNIDGLANVNNLNATDVISNSGFTVLTMKVDSTRTVEAYIYDMFVSPSSNQFRNLKSENVNIIGVNRTKKQYTDDLYIQNSQSKGVVYDGDLEISGDINTNKYVGTGAIEAKEIKNSSLTDTNIESSAFLGGYAEIGGKVNDSKTGIQDLDNVTVKDNVIISMNEGSVEENKFSLYNNGSKTVSINQSESGNLMNYIDKGAKLTNSKNQEMIRIESGDITINEISNPDSLTFTKPNVPLHVGGKTIVADATPYRVIVNERFDDVFETAPAYSKFRMPLLEDASGKIRGHSDYDVFSMQKAGILHGALASLVRSTLANDLIHINNKKTSGPATGATGDKGIRGDKGEVGEVGDTGGDGAKGQKGSGYNPEAYIWLNVDQIDTSFCATEDDLMEQYPTSTEWKYENVIEGECPENENEFKHFQDKTRSCKTDSDRGFRKSGFRTEVYQCKKALHRLEPFTPMIIPAFSVCEIEFEEEVKPPKKPDESNGDLIESEDTKEVEEDLIGYDEWVKIRDEFKGIRDAFGISKSFYYSDCIIENRVHYTNEDNDGIKKLKNSFVVTPESLRDFTELRVHDPKTPLDILKKSYEKCESGKYMQVSICNKTSIDTSKYTTHPTGFVYE